MAASSPFNQTDIPSSDALPNRSASPLLWLLLLAVVAAFAWYLYQQRQASILTPGAPIPTATTTTPGTTTPAASTERGSERSVDRTQPARVVRADRAASPIAPGKPAYPIAAVRAHEEGLVMVRVDVDANGHPTRTAITRHSGSRDLDRAALASVQAWQFKPAIEDGKQVASSVVVPVDFRLASR